MVRLHRRLEVILVPLDVGELLPLTLEEGLDHADIFFEGIKLDWEGSKEVLRLVQLAVYLLQFF